MGFSTGSSERLWIIEPNPATLKAGFRIGFRPGILAAGTMNSLDLGIARVADTRTADELAPISVSETPEAKFREFLEIRGEKLTEPRLYLSGRSSIRTSTSTPTNWSATSTRPDTRSAGRPSTGRSACWSRPASSAS